MAWYERNLKVRNLNVAWYERNLNMARYDRNLAMVRYKMNFKMASYNRNLKVVTYEKPKGGQVRVVVSYEMTLRWLSMKGTFKWPCIRGAYPTLGSSRSRTAAPTCATPQTPWALHSTVSTWDQLTSTPLHQVEYTRHSIHLGPADQHIPPPGRVHKAQCPSWTS